MTWTVTHKGWCLACPVWIAQENDEAIVPIPRFTWLGWWLEVQLFIQDRMINGLMPEEQRGFVFWRVEPVPSFRIEC